MHRQSTTKKILLIKSKIYNSNKFKKNYPRISRNNFKLTFFYFFVGYITFQTIQHSGSGNIEKCFYLSNDTNNWTESQRSCHSQKLELANIGTKEEMVRKGEVYNHFNTFVQRMFVQRE